MSPDGRRLATSRPLTQTIIVRAVAPGGANSEGVPHGRGLAPNSWSPSGDVLAALTSLSPFRTGFLGIGGRVQVPDVDGAFVSFSPDGRWLAYRSTKPARQKLSSGPMRAEKMSARSRLAAVANARWSPTGELYYRNGNRWYMTRVTTTPEPRWDPPRLVFETEFIDTPGLSYDVTRDGQRLLVVKRSRPITQTRIEIVSNWIELLERAR